jgi:hypothetical protein
LTAPGRAAYCSRRHDVYLMDADRDGMGQPPLITDAAADGFPG